LEDLGIELDAESLKKVTQRIIELGDKKETVTSDELPYIVADVLENDIHGAKNQSSQFFSKPHNGTRPVASVSLEIEGTCLRGIQRWRRTIRCFRKALRKIYKRLGKSFPKLIDYVVTIPPGGKTDALVETVITWKNSREFKTKGLDPDQNAAAIKATIRMLNIIENELKPGLMEKILSGISYLNFPLMLLPIFL
jgi:(R)-citramalate synthase